MTKINKEKLKKLILIVIYLTILQSGLFFISKLFVTNPHYLSSALDDKIPFCKYFVYFYYSWYILLFIVPIYLGLLNKKYLKKYISTFIICIIILFLFYIIYPTTMIRPTITVHDFTDLLIYIVYFFDTPAYNLLPSGHVVMAVLFITSTITVKEIPWYIKTLILILAIFISASTVLIKQHVLIDIFFGIILAVVVSIIVSLYFKIKKQES